MKKNNNKSFWPYGITLAILAVVIMGAGTIMIALKHPVQMDEAYLEKQYQEVDGHINEIKESQKLFSQQYKIILSNTKFKIGQNRLKIDVLDKYSNRHVNNMKLSVKITRPDSDRFDIKLKSKDGENKGYLFHKFNIDKYGRWIVLIKASNGKFEGFLRKEIDVSGNS
jgi:hypothetical protein